MNKRLLTLIAIFAFALTAAGCAGMNGLPEGLPSIEVGFTEVGNPDEDEAQLKGVYVNDEFDIAISYPIRFSVNEISSGEALFSSDDGEQMTYSFLWLEDGDTFDSFIVDVRGGFYGLESVSDSYFDDALCSEEPHPIRSGMKTVECYYYRENGSFVMVETGIIKDDAEFETTSRIPSSPDSGKANSPLDIPEKLPAPQSGDMDIPTVMEYPEDIQAIINESSERSPVKRLPLPSR